MVQSLCCLVSYCCSSFFGYILLILTSFVNYVYHLIEKTEEVCEIHYFSGGHIHTVYKISGLKIAIIKKY